MSLFAVFEHGGYERPNAVGDPDDVHGIGPLPVLLGERPNAAFGLFDSNARVIEEQVHVAVSSEYAFRKCVDGLGARDVDLHAIDLETMARKLATRRLDRLPRRHLQ